MQGNYKYVNEVFELNSVNSYHHDTIRISLWGSKHDMVMTFCTHSSFSTEHLRWNTHRPTLNLTTGQAIVTPIPFSHTSIPISHMFVSKHSSSLCINATDFITTFVYLYLKFNHVMWTLPPTIFHWLLVVSMHFG